jgi:hypothetical protein
MQVEIDLPRMWSLIHYAEGAVSWFSIGKRQTAAISKLTGTPLDQQAYTHLVRRLELDANFHPSAFRRKLILISCSAYPAALFIALIVMVSLL